MIVYENLSLEHVEQLWSMMNELDNQTKYMMFEENERSEKSSINNLENNIKNTILSNDFFVVAKEEEKIIGYISAKLGNFNRNKHCAYIIIGILKDFQGKKIGSCLFEMLIYWAKTNNIKRLELTVLSQNINAIRLYEKFGFKIEGIREKSMIIDGSFFDELYMSRILE